MREKTFSNKFFLLAIILISCISIVEAGSSGAIWTRRDGCGGAKDENQYGPGEDVWIEGYGFEPQQLYSWTIKGAAGGSSCDPSIEVDSGIITTGIDGSMCFFAYRIKDDDCGVYSIDVGYSSNDNYQVTCVDHDQDGFEAGPFLGCIEGDDCDDSDPYVSPDSYEDCSNGLDDDCDGLVDCLDSADCSGYYICKAECTADSDCDDNKFCNGQESCREGRCIGGTPIDCSQNDIDPILSCFEEPDYNPYTLDYYKGFISKCDEQEDRCTEDSIVFIHTCDIDACNAECEVDEDCPYTDCDHLDGCVGENYYDYNDILSQCVGYCYCAPRSCQAPVIYYGDPRCEKECFVDDDCNYLEIDECSGSRIMHDEYTCWQNNCILKAVSGVDCNDNQFCNGEETCLNAECTDPAIPDCGDENICTVDSCDEVHDTCENNQISDCCILDSDCDDLNACTQDSCSLNTCINIPLTCDDNIECTIDSCNQELGCQFTPDNNYCNDGNDCTEDLCSQGCINTPKTLDTACELDGIGCTLDYCDGFGNCVQLDNECGCLSDDDCFGDICNNGKCDLDTYTCYTEPLPDGTACNDDNLCTMEGICADGECIGTEKVCDDENACTNDFCNPLDGECTVQLIGQCAFDYQCTNTDCDGLDGCIGYDYYDYGDIDGKCVDCACQSQECTSPVISYNDSRCTQCQTDADCDAVVTDTCDGDSIKNRYQTCIDYSCHEQTIVIKDCNIYNEYLCNVDTVVYNDYTCENAVCILESSAPVEDCNNFDSIFCYEDDVWESNGYCNEGSCITENLIYHTCTDTCNDGSCVDINCYSDEECGIDTYVSDPYCLDQDIYRDYETNICNEPGTINAYCSDSITSLLYKECIFGCIGNSCFLPQCSDGIDNDGDGFTDSKDPGCETPQDNDEYNPKDRSFEILPRKQFLISQIRTNKLVYDEVFPGELLYVDLTFENIGKLDTKYATIRITQYELGISKKLGPFIGPEIDEVMSQGLYLEIPRDADPGVYTLRITLSDLDGIKRTRHRDFIIK